MTNSKSYKILNTISIILLLITQSILISTMNLKSKHDSKEGKNKKELEIANYKYPNNKNKDSVTIAIIGTNDIHGQAYEKADIPFRSEKVRVGGYKLLSGVIDIIREEFGSNSLWFDAGDQFTGTYERELTKGKLMTDFYNVMKVDAVAIGNHEWDKKEPQLRDWMTSELGSLYNGKDKVWSEDIYGKFGKNLYLDANLKLKEGNQNPLPNQMPSRIFEFENGKIKIGVIGLTTLESVVKSPYFSKNNFDLLQYKNVVEATSKFLREKGAQAVLILSHVGMLCRPNDFTPKQIDELYELKLRDNSYKADGTCKGEIIDMLNEIDPNSIDGIIAGHIHDSVHHFFKDIPVIQNPINNVFTNVLYLNFKKQKNGSYVFNRKNTLIEGPIPLCSKVYTNNRRCNIYQEVKGNLTFTDFTFHKKKIQPNKNVLQLFETDYADINKKIEDYKNTIICKNEVFLERKLTQENVLANLITDIIRKSTNADVAMNTPGSLRYTWDVGYITKYSLNNMLPFGGNFSSYKIKGKDLKKILVTLQQDGRLGYLYAFSGIKMTLIKQPNDRYILDIDSLVLDGGKKINDEQEYSLGSNEFLLKGGDDMAYVKDKISTGPIENSKDIIDSVEKELKYLNVITKEYADSLLGRIIIKSPE